MGKKKDKREKKAGKRMNKKQLAALLMDYFHEKGNESVSLKKIFEQLRLTTHPLKMLCMDLLADLKEDDYITETEHHVYRLHQRGVEMTGRFVRKNNGKNSFIPDDGGDPIFIAERNSAHAMNNDRVRIAYYARRRGKTAEGEVLEILERANDSFVGTLEVTKGYAFLLTENRTLANDIFIPKDKLKGGRTGDKAVVKIIEWPDKAKNPIGQVIDILGRAGDNNTEMHAILAEFGLPYSYPENVEAAADKIPDAIPAEEIAKREDFRRVTTFTIDPKDAKDFDDALSIRSLGGGQWEVGVHIADVTHYVKEGTVIDKEAERRATSVYLVDRTIPMLPERLCNLLCSLRPDEEKLAYSVIFQMNDKAEVQASRIVHTVIKSDRRFTYEARPSARCPRAKRRRYSPTASTTCPTPPSWTRWRSSSPASATNCARQATGTTSRNPSTGCWMTSRARRSRTSSRQSPSVPCRRHATPRTTSGTTAWALNTTHTSPRPSDAIRT